MSRSFIFDAKSGSRIRLGNFGTKGAENPETQMCIDVTQCIVWAGGKGEEEEEEADVVQIFLTVPQVAEIVKQFFWEIISPGNIYTKLLERLLHRRRQLMTSEIAKTRLLGHDVGRPWMPPYDKLET
jgi:hypothetical protein